MVSNVGGVGPNPKLTAIAASKTAAVAKTPDNKKVNDAALQHLKKATITITNQNEMIEPQSPRHPEVVTAKDGIAKGTFGSNEAGYTNYDFSDMVKKHGAVVVIFNSDGQMTLKDVREQYGLPNGTILNNNKDLKDISRVNEYIDWRVVAVPLKEVGAKGGKQNTLDPKLAQSTIDLTFKKNDKTARDSDTVGQ